MDISVSRLNKRMALELPPEFPLGLVFVVGEVKKMSIEKGNGRPIEFYLSESGYKLNCRLSDRAAGEIILNEGDLIRAGGHLAFEPAQAGYYLLARDVEILSEYRPSRSALKRIVADKQERIQTSNLVPAEIPPWVEQLAPPEIRAELEERKSSAVGFEAAAGDVWKLYAGTDVGIEFPADEPIPASIDSDLLDFLSEAMDGQEDVELTPELLAEFESSKELAGPTGQDLEVLKELEAALMMTIFKEDSLPPAELGQAPLSKIKKVSSGDLRTDLQLEGRTDELPEEPQADIELTAIEGLEEDQVETGIRRVNKDFLSKPANQAVKNLKPPEHHEPEPLSSRPPAQPNQVAPSQYYIPWYVVGLVILLVFLFLAVFVVVSLNSNLLPLPITWPG
jgi:hypothetical protein